MNTAELMLKWATEFCESTQEKLYQTVRREIDGRAQEGWLYVYIDNDFLSPLHPIGNYVTNKLQADGFLIESNTGGPMDDAFIKVMWSPAAIKLRKDVDLLTDQEFCDRYHSEMEEGNGDHELCCV